MYEIDRSISMSTTDSDSDDFCEITTSDPDSYSSSDEETAEMLEFALEGTYTCSPSLFLNGREDPAERTSLLYLDKDLMDSESMEGVYVCISQFYVLCSCLLIYYR